MRVKITKSNSTTLFYIIESTYINKKHSSRTVEKLGTLEEVLIKANGEDPYVWAKNYAKRLTEQEKINSREVVKYFSKNRIIEKNEKKYFNCGYLFLQRIYYDLKINKICEKIHIKRILSFNLNSILSNLVYSTLIYGSYEGFLENTKNFIEQPKLWNNDVKNCLEVLSQEFSFIKKEIYINYIKYLKDCNITVDNFDTIENDVEKYIQENANNVEDGARYLIYLIALIIIRIMEIKLNDHYFSNEILKMLKNYNLYIIDKDFIPVFIRTELTDLLHENFHFRMDYEIMSEKYLFEVCRKSKE